MNAKPEFSFHRNIGHVAWTDPAVAMKFDQLRLERRTAELSGEVTVTSSANGNAGLLHRGRLNLSSTRAQAELAKQLTGRMAGLDWSGLIETARWKVIEAFREGPPAFLLRDAIEPPATGWALPPILLASDPVILFGDGGSLKSYTSLSFAVSLQSGILLSAGLEPARPFRVAYCDWEWSDWPHKKRLRALCGPGELPEILYVPCQAGGPLSHQVERIQRIFEEHRVDYAVIDSVGLACDGPPEEAQSALGFFQSLARLEVGSLLVAHTSRDADGTKPFGSAFWHNSARATWAVKRLRASGSGIDISLHQRKANDGAMREEPIGLHFEFCPGSTAISAAQLESGQEAAGAGALRDRFAEALRAAGRPLTYTELARAAKVEGTQPTGVVWGTVKRYPGTFTVLKEVPHHRVVLTPSEGHQQAPSTSSSKNGYQQAPQQEADEEAAEAQK